MKTRKLLVFITILIAACTPKKESTTIDLAAYQDEINEWHADRIENLKGDNGWLNLAGLYWLNEGFNTFGSATTNDVVFPEGKIEDNAGTFVVQEGRVMLLVQDGVEILVDSAAAKSVEVYDPSKPSGPVMSHGSLQWYIINRSGKLGVRLRDLESAAVANFPGVDRYPVDPKWRLEANFENYDPPRSINITNILGQTYPQPSPGALVFNIDGKEFRLDVIDEGGDDYFIIYGDQTNEHETYPSGRYMYVHPPDENGKVIVDFNKGYNPPCAFTAFATCPLPPKQNVLDVAITSGEKNFGDH